MVNKTTNHRVVKRHKNKTRVEMYAELKTLHRSISETKALCDPNNHNYTKSFHIISNYIKQAIAHGSKVFLLRLPLHQKLINYENDNCNYFLKDIVSLAKEYNIDFLDLNTPDHLKNIGHLDFYIDGQHVDHMSSQRISRYISKFINNNNK